MLNFFISLFSFLLIVTIMVFIHELGHFYVARLCKVKVDIFAIGFGKTLWSKIDKHGTEWKINLLPLGGYVKMFGDAGPASDIDIQKINSMTKVEQSQTFFHKKLWQKTLIVFAGPLMNYVLAFIVMIFILALYGDQTISTKVNAVEENSPAAQAGIIAGDIIVSVNSYHVRNFFELKNIINNIRHDKPIAISILRNENKIDMIVSPIKMTLPNGQEISKIGVIGSVENVHYTFFESISNAAEKIYMLNLMMLDGVIKLLSGNGSKEELGGPIKIAQITGEAAKHGMQSFLGLLVLLSINLGLLNLLPIPGLDGGHLFYYLIHAVIGRPINVRVQEMSIKLGFLLLISLMIFVTYNDILGLFKVN